MIRTFLVGAIGGSILAGILGVTESTAIVLSAMVTGFFTWLVARMTVRTRAKAEVANSIDKRLELFQAGLEKQNAELLERVGEAEGEARAAKDEAAHTRIALDNEKARCDGLERELERLTGLLEASSARVAYLEQRLGFRLPPPKDGS